MTKRHQAAIINERARQLQEKGRLKEAVKLYKEAADIDRSWGTPLYNLGLLFKKEHDWEKSLKYNQRAAKLEPDNDAAWWNLGIAATALGRWDVARSAWRGFGIKVPDGEGPLDFPCGYGPFRINPEGDAEVVWGDRIDPARAVLFSIPFPESKFRWRDVVLHDGAPNGYRQHKGNEIPVFDVLERLEPSPFVTFVARVRMPSKPEYVEQLAKLAAEQDSCAEDWTTSTRMLCKACSEGRPHELHDREASPKDDMHMIGIAARDRENAEKMLSTWESQANDIHVEWLDNGLAEVE
jgi:tetratricopeptide (TPR) repeat protein